MTKYCVWYRGSEAEYVGLCYAYKDPYVGNTLEEAQAYADSLATSQNISRNDYVVMQLTEAE